MERRLRTRVAGRELVVTHLEKPLWPADGLTKGDLIHYLVTVAPVLLPYLRDRPLVCTRYPDGIHRPGFYQKNAPEGAPAWVRTWPRRSRDGRVIRYILADEPATLAWLGQLAAVEIHPWHSRIQRPDCPDWVVFDLDPGPRAAFRHVVEVALELRRVLATLGLVGCPKTSGATGLHVLVPILPEYRYPVVTAWARQVARRVETLLPKLVTTERSVAKRPPQAVYLDFLQNAPGKTVVTVYGPRPRPGGTVSMPVRWDELERGLDPGAWTLRTAPARLQRVGDLFRPVLTLRQSLPAALPADGHRPVPAHHAGRPPEARPAPTGPRWR